MEGSELQNYDKPKIEFEDNPNSLTYVGSSYVSPSDNNWSMLSCIFLMILD